MPSSGLGAYQVKIHQLVFGGLVMAMALLGVRSLAVGNVTNIKMLGALSIVAAGFFALDKYYWLACPFLMVIPFSIPGLPFGSGELGRLLLVGVFFVRAALKRESARAFPKEILIAFPYFFWVAAIFLLNPTGMNILGSGTIGGRFYFQIALAFLTLLTFSRLALSEQDARYWVYMLIMASLFRFLMALSGFVTLEFGEDSSKYFLIPACPLLLILLCRYDLNQIFSLSWRFPASVLLALAVAYSGKRSSMGQVFLAPFILVFLRKREKGLLLLSVFIGASLLAFVIAGHGQLYELPFSVQRSLSFLPGKWDRSLENFGMNDLFREELHDRAKAEIRRSPWVGNKGYTINREQVSWAITQMSRDGYGGHAMVGNWHNKFYGMGADFGLPASIFWYFFAGLAVWYCVRNRRFLVLSGYRRSLFLYYSLYMFYDLFFAFGHSALTPYEQWTYFGFIVALVRCARDEAMKNSFPRIPQSNVAAMVDDHDIPVVV